MTTELKQIIEKSKKLSANERALVAHMMINSLENVIENDVEEAWLQLAEERFQELDSGKIQGVSWDEIEHKIRQK